MEYDLSTLSRKTSAVEFVGINKIKTVDLTSLDAKPSSIAVCGLGACTVLAIVSSMAIVVANIGPDALPSHERSDPRSYIQLASDMFAWVERDYRQYGTLFDEGTTAYLIYNTCHRVISCPEQITVLRDGLDRIGLHVKEHGYETSHQDLIRGDSLHGSMWIDTSGMIPGVFLEGRQVTSSPWLIVEHDGTPSLYRCHEPREWSQFPKGTWVEYVDKQRFYIMLVYWDGKIWLNRNDIGT